MLNDAILRYIYIYIYDLSVDLVQVSVLDLRSNFCTTQASELGFPSVHQPQLHQSALAALQYHQRQSVGLATVWFCTPLFANTKHTWPEKWTRKVFIIDKEEMIMSNNLHYFNFPTLIYIQPQQNLNLKFVGPVM